MSALATSSAVLHRFDRICAALVGRERGITLTELGAAHSLALELESLEPDAHQVRALCADLCLDVATVEALHADSRDGRGAP